MENQNLGPWPNFLRVEILALILALLVQGAGLIWWGSQITARVSVLENKVTAASHQGEDIARIDERTKSIDESVARIERRLDAEAKGK